MRGSRTRALALPVVALLALPLAACAADADTGLDLARAGCPTEIRVLTDSDPRAQQGALFQLLAADPDIDPATRSITAPLVVAGEPTGVDLTIVAGDQFAEASTAQRLYFDEDDFLLAAVDADAAIVDADQYPTVGIFAPLERDPQIILWDPVTYPGVNTIAELGISFDVDGVPVPILSAPRNLALDFFVGSELIDPAQPLRVDDGTTAAFIAAAGHNAQVGDVTVDPRRIQRSDGWREAVRFELVEDAGYPRYVSMLSARPDDVSRFADCFRLLVPILQQASLDYARDPAPAIAVIVDAAATFGTSPDYDLEAATRAADILVERNLIGNGEDDAVGDVDGGKLQNLFDIAIPALRNQGYVIPPGLTHADIATNAFIDPSIGF